MAGGLSRRITLPERLPRLRALLVLDNLAGHKTPSLVLWLIEHGIMPLYTPLGGSWLNMAESIQRILKRRALERHHPQTPEEITEWLEAAARAGTRPRPRLNGAAVGQPVGGEAGSAGTRWAAPGPSQGARCAGRPRCSSNGSKQRK